MPDILANGIRIYYEERGAGPAMVWAHGLGQTWHGWDGVMTFFQDRYRVIAYDARGHGRSEIPDRPEAYSQDIMVQDMRGLVDALGITQAIVGGLPWRYSGGHRVWFLRPAVVAGVVG
jgi:pimeloyl-ACP methyl ester carboxylesterase